MLDVRLGSCSISSFVYTRPSCWATDKAIDPMFQLRAFNFVFYFFLQHGMSHSLASVTAILEENWLSCGFLLDVGSEAFQELWILSLRHRP